ncbi:MAG: DUF1559 domain-containing protein [Planctomycetia bacterium]|nr:DUF1559 domain-containing protein [Planctomycetia bacterium]
MGGGGENRNFLKSALKAFGFTLVELLVVIAIIGILIGLLLPAVQAAREAARRMACTNKLKQLSLATQNYHDSYNALPAGKCGPYGKTSSFKNRWSLFVAILPYLEQGPLYDRILGMDLMTAVESGSNWMDPGILQKPESPMAARIDAFLCDSDSVPRTMPVNFQGPVNYRWCLGDNAAGQVIDSIPTPDSADNRGCRGAFGNYSFYNLAAIIDGTSNTLAFSERCMADRTTGTATETKQKLAYAKYTSTSGSPFAGSSPSYLSNRSTCINAVTNGLYTTSAGVHTGGGYCFGHGLFYITAFTAIIPPNGPSCIMTSGSWNTILTPSSYHQGGVNAALLDGSVRFISETIDAGTANSFGTTDGNVKGISPFGVWGAMGSRDGGESTAP